MLAFFILFHGWLAHLPLIAQSSLATNPWKTLADVSFKTKKENNYQIDYPVFGKKVQALQGQTIRLKGYVLPMEVGNQNTFIFSLLPYSSCFFCGGAGPETVIEVNSRKSIAYQDRPIVIEGRLELNGQDADHLMYILREAVKIN